jgi:hypothetical protein
MLVKGGGIMPHIARGDDFAALDERNRFADYDTIHKDVVAGSEILRGKFVFGWNVRYKGASFAGDGGKFAFRQICKGDPNIIARVES